MKKKARARESARAPSPSTSFISFGANLHIFFLAWGFVGGGGGAKPPRNFFLDFQWENIIIFLE